MGIAYNTSVVRDGLNLQLDFANAKSYPGSGTTVYNLVQGNNNFTTQNSPTIANGYMIADGNNPGSHIVEQTGGLGNQGTNSFTYQFLIRPKSYTSADSPGEARIYEHTGFPDTYHIFRLTMNFNNFRFNFFVNDGTSSYGITTLDYPTSLMDTWMFLTCMINRGTSIFAIYVNDQKITSGFGKGVTIGSVGNNDVLRIPSSYAEIEADYACVLGYTRALSDAEVLQNLEAVRGRYGI